MSKSEAVDQSDETISQKIRTLNAQMERHAETGAWQQVTEIAVQRDAMLADVPLAERSSAYLSAQQSTKRVLDFAEEAQSGVAEQLSSIQRGRKATDSYGENS